METGDKEKKVNITKSVYWERDYCLSRVMINLIVVNSLLTVINNLMFSGLKEKEKKIQTQSTTKTNESTWNSFYFDIRHNQTHKINLKLSINGNPFFFCICNFHFLIINFFFLLDLRSQIHSHIHNGKGNNHN